MLSICNSQYLKESSETFLKSVICGSGAQLFGLRWREHLIEKAHMVIVYDYF